MTHTDTPGLSAIDAVRLERDLFRADLMREREARRWAEMLLRYAAEAAYEEYRLRMAER